MQPQQFKKALVPLAAAVFYAAAAVTVRGDWPIWSEWMAIGFAVVTAYGVWQVRNAPPLPAPEPVDDPERHERRGTKNVEGLRGDLL